MIQSAKPISTVLVLVAAVAVGGCQRDAASNENASATEFNNAKAIALSAKDALFARLSWRLTEVMKSKGPAAAIEVCSREAVNIAKSVGEEHGVTIGRTAARLRNPSNVAPDWAKQLIEDPSAEPQFVQLPHGRTGALLPIKLQSKCLICHGPADQIAGNVKTQLAKLYPDDRATGFKAGDLRGWFWIEVP